MDYKKTGQLIAECRHSNGLTQIQLAEKLGVSNRAVSKWECGNGFPDVSILEPLADALKLSVIELIHGERKLVNDKSENDKSEMEVRSAIRIVGMEAQKQLSRFWSLAKACIALLLALVIGWNMFEFFITDGDGFKPVENARGVRQGYENNCKNLATRGISKIEISSDKKCTGKSSIYNRIETRLDPVSSYKKSKGRIALALVLPVSFGDAEE